MSLSFSQGKINGELRQKIVQEVHKQMKAAACAAVKEVAIEFLEAPGDGEVRPRKGEAAPSG